MNKKKQALMRTHGTYI